VRKGLIGKIGENMSFRRFKRFAGNGKLASYLHGTRIGVMVEFEATTPPPRTSRCTSPP
jgi:elongation factor Ts